jgi:hypothetical protein
MCFFCSAPLAKEDASVEHLVAQANGGANGDDNCVACCKAVNALLGRMSLKEKIRVVLNQKGTFVCPNSAEILKPQSLPPEAAPRVNVIAPPKVDSYAIVLADLKRRGASRPRKIETLKNTIRTTVKSAKGSLTDAQLETLLRHLQENEKVVVSGTKVSYSL